MRRVFLALVTAVAGCSFAVAEDFQLEEGFTRLDNGKDLSGWGKHGEDWSVVDGAIHLDTGKRPAAGILYSEKKHGRDLVLRLQFRATHAADSGVFLHGAQFQVRDYPNSLPDTRRFAPHARPAGQWNDLEFDVAGGAAQVRLNGQVIAEKWKIGARPELGVGLQREKGDFDFRYIRIREK